jgi:hypothetical protein
MGVRLISTSQKYSSGILVPINHIGVSKNIYWDFELGDLYPHIGTTVTMLGYESPSSK